MLHKNMNPENWQNSGMKTQKKICNKKQKLAKKKNWQSQKKKKNWQKTGKKFKTSWRQILKKSSKIGHKSFGIQNSP